MCDRGTDFKNLKELAYVCFDVVADVDDDESKAKGKGKLNLESRRRTIRVQSALSVLKCMLKDKQSLQTTVRPRPPPLSTPRPCPPSQHRATMQRTRKSRTSCIQDPKLVKP